MATKSHVEHSWEYEAEGSLSGLVLNDDEVFNPISAVKEHVEKLAPEIAGHDTHCISRFRLDMHVEKQINNMINVEYGMSYAFQSMSNFFNRDCVALPGLATLFQKRSDETRSNAIVLSNYMATRGGCVLLKTIPAPDGEFNHEKGDALYGMEIALSMEKAETDKFLALNKAAEDVVDEQLSDFITDTFLDKQHDLLYKHASYISQLRRVDKGHGHWDWDHKLAEKLGASDVGRV